MYNVIISGSNPDSQKKIAGIGAVINVLLKNKNVNYHLIPVGKLMGQGTGFLWFISQFKLIIRLLISATDKKFSIVHVNSCTNPNAIIRDAFIVGFYSLFNKKVVLHMHGGKYLFRKPKNMFLRFLLNFSCKKSSFIIVLSEYEMQHFVLREEYYSKLMILKNCINYSEVPDVLLQDKNFNKLFFIGRIVESKGIEDLIEALRILSKQRQDFEFVLCGDGVLRESTINSLNEIQNLKFTYAGILNGAEKWKIYKNGGIFLLPSRHGEGLPMALIEAIATKNIAIVTSDASMRVIIQHNSNGLIVNKYAPREIAESINFILENKSEAFRIAESAYNYYLDNFNLDQFYATIEKIYQEL